MLDKDPLTCQLNEIKCFILVNNVGIMYDYPDVLLNISQQKLWQLIYVNIGAATMVRLFTVKKIIYQLDTFFITC